MTRGSFRPFIDECRGSGIRSASLWADACRSLFQQLVERPVFRKYAFRQSQLPDPQLETRPRFHTKHRAVRQHLRMHRARCATNIAAVLGDAIRWRTIDGLPSRSPSARSWPMVGAHSKFALG